MPFRRKPLDRACDFPMLVRRKGKDFVRVADRTVHGQSERRGGPVKLDLCQQLNLEAIVFLLKTVGNRINIEVI